ncbi:MAG TPA: response regulator transcription factor [Puia sp.]|jgi:DNA-binding response OmpR family regulator|nr:response regulator transcription factor [Puia sp.]
MSRQNYFKYNPVFFQNRIVSLLPKDTTLKILIIEEEKGSSRSLLQYLRREGYLCDLSQDAGDMPDEVHPSGYDCILLNSTTSDLAGIRVLRTLKKQDYNGGVIFLSVQDTPEARIAGLNAGADDYLSQPVNLAELNARISTLVRRKHFSGNPIIHFNELSIDLPGKAAFVHQKPVDLTRKEFDLLLFLASHPNKIMSKEAIAVNLAEERDVHESVDFIYAHIKNLKKKLAAAGCADYINSIYGMGYKFML